MGLAPSPTASRVVEIMELLVRQPTEALSASDISRALGQNRTTCQAVLLALESADWVRRDERKAYSLGPGALAIGVGARSSMPVVDELRRELSVLSASLGVEVTGSMVAQGNVLIVARSGQYKAFAPTMQVGQSFPLAPPFGLVFVAWDEDAVERWIARSPTVLSPRESEAHRRAAHLVRTLGYSVTFDPTTRRIFGELLNELSADAPANDVSVRRDELIKALVHDEYLMTDAHSQLDQPVSQIAVPVFGHGSSLEAALSVVLFPHQLSLDKVGEFAQALKDSANRISARLLGETPAASATMR
jgi:DNA-binding IclR family transcriptional regulator